MGTSNGRINWEKFEYEHVCEDPKDGELSRTMPAKEVERKCLDSGQMHHTSTVTSRISKTDPAIPPPRSTSVSSFTGLLKELDGSSFHLVPSIISTMQWICATALDLLSMTCFSCAHGARHVPGPATLGSE